MSLFRLLIDGVNYNPPKGLEDVSIRLQFENNALQFFTEGTVTYYEANHGAIFSILKTAYDSDRCFEKTWTLQYQRLGSWLTFSEGKIKGEGCRFDLGQSAAEVTLFSESGIEQLNDNQSDTFIENPNTDVRFFQYESGGWYEDPSGAYDTRQMKKFTDHVIALGSEYGVTISPSGVLTTLHQNHEHEITIGAVSSGDTFEFNMASVFGSTFRVTIEANISDTVSDIAQKLCKGILHVRTLGSTGYLIEAQENIHRVASCTESGGVMTISTDWKVESISLTQNGTPIAITETQAYQWGLEDLYISTEGLNDDKEISTTWSGIFELMKNLFDGVILENNTNLTLSSFVDEFSTIPTTFIQKRKVSISPEEDFMKKKGRFSSAFRLEGVGDFNETWNWLGGGTTQDITIIVPPIATPAIVAVSGIGSLSGSITYQNIGATTQTYQIDIEVNLAGGGYVVVGSRTITIYPNQTYPAITIESFFNNPNDNKFCFLAGDLIRMQYSNTTNLTIPASYVRLSQGSSCFEVPQIREQSLSTRIYNEFPAMSNCKGVFDRTLAEDFYTGTGYAISQVFNGDFYEDNTFLVLTEDDSGDQVAKKWIRQIYYPDDVDLDSAGCSCLKDEIIDKYFYNMILQLPWIIEIFRNRLPFDIEVEAYDFETDVSSTDVYTHTTTNTTAVITKKTTKFDKAEFETAFSIDDFDTIKTQKGLQLSVGSVAKNGLIMEIRFSLNGKNSSQIVLV